MAAPGNPTFSTIVRAAAREASEAAQKHIDDVVASSLSHKSAVGARLKAAASKG